MVLLSWLVATLKRLEIERGILPISFGNIKWHKKKQKGREYDQIHKFEDKNPLSLFMR